MEKYADWMKDKKVDINQNFWNDFSVSEGFGVFKKTVGFAFFIAAS